MTLKPIKGVNGIPLDEDLGLALAELERDAKARKRAGEKLGSKDWRPCPLEIETRAMIELDKRPERRKRGPNFVSRAQLYRHYDFGGSLLYVGISLSALTRLEGHKRKSGWFGQIAFVTVQHYASREEAEAAEAQAIRSEQPIYNRRHKAIPWDQFDDPQDEEPHSDETWENDGPRDFKSPRNP